MLFTALPHTHPGSQEGTDKVGAATKGGDLSSYCHLCPVQTQGQGPGVVSFPFTADLGLSRSHQVVLIGTSGMLALMTGHFSCSSLCPVPRGSWVKLLPLPAPILHSMSPQFLCTKCLWFMHCAARNVQSYFCFWFFVLQLSVPKGLC